MSQDDERELSEIGRSIDSLFTPEEEFEKAPAEPSGSEAQPQSEVAATPEPGPLSQAVETPVEPEPTPVEPEPTSAEPEPTPAEPEPTPVGPEPTQSEIGKVLSEATSDYLQAPVGNRGEVESALRSAVEAARSGRGGTCAAHSSLCDTGRPGGSGDCRRPHRHGRPLGS